MVKVRVANPGPAALMVINPRRKKPMATKRRRSTKRRTTARRRPSTAVAANPVRRRRRSTASRRRATVHASTGYTRRRNPARRYTRRRNPSGTIGKALPLAVAIAGVGIIGGFVPPIGGSSPIFVAARQAGLGYLLGIGMQKTGILRAHAEDVKLAGVALGIGTLINAYVLPMVGGFLRPAPAGKPGAGGQGMNDIVTLPRGSYDSYYGATPIFATGAPRGMNDVVTLPRRVY